LVHFYCGCEKIPDGCRLCNARNKKTLQKEKTMPFRQRILLVLFMLMFLCTAKGWATEVFKIGVAGAHSGDLASYGLPTVRAAELVLEEIESQGGLRGAKVELLVEDDVCKPEVAANIAAKLVSAGVQVVLGHICSGATKAALPTYTEADILVMSPSATDSDLTLSGAYPTFYRTIAPNNAQAAAIVDFVTNVLEVKKVALLHDKGDYGKGLAEDARSLIQQEAKVEVMLFEGITPGAVDYSAVVQKIRRARVDAVIYGGYHPEASKLVTQMRRRKMDTLFISDDGVKDDTFIRVAGRHAEGVYATGPKDVSGNTLTKHYRQAYTEKYGGEPGPFFDNAVTAVLALTNALEKAKSTDSQALAEVLRNQVTRTPFGEIMFNEQGDAIGVGYSMYVVKNGVFEPVVVH
jgi:branched-chain amino acid transport system substrate-binding protein